MEYRAGGRNQGKSEAAEQMLYTWLQHAKVGQSAAVMKSGDTIILTKSPLQLPTPDTGAE